MVLPKGRSVSNGLSIGKAPNLGLIFTFGTDIGHASFSTRWDIPEQPNDYSVRSSGRIGQEILDGNGIVVVWTTVLLSDWTNEMLASQ